MNREEEREHAAYDFVNTDCLTVEHYPWSFNYFIKGAIWADEHPRTDIIGVDSINRIRPTLLRNFTNIARKYPNTMLDDIPEKKEAFDLITNFDKACEIAGFELNNDTGFYKIK